MNCSTCRKPAVYVYDVTPEHSIPYCASCVPGFLRPRLRAGLLRSADAWQAAVEEAKASLALPEPAAPQVAAPKRTRKPKTA